MKKGEIILLELPLSNGHEQFGLRPAILLSREINNMVFIVPLTTKRSALKYHFTINVENSKLKGLKENSTALVFQMRALDKKIIKKKLGKLEEDLLSRINKLITEIFELK